MPESARVYVYHNLVKFTYGVAYHKMDSVTWDDPWLKKRLKPGTPGFRLYNNVFVYDAPFINRHGKVAPNYEGDYNLYTSPKNDALVTAGIDEHGIFEARPEFVSPRDGNWLLEAGSDGAHRGIDLMRYPDRLSLPPGYPKRPVVFQVVCWSTPLSAARPGTSARDPRPRPSWRAA